MTVSWGFRRVTERLFPFCCQICGQASGRRLELCEPCELLLPKLTGAVCRCCEAALPLQHDILCGACLASPPAFARLRGLYAYEGAVRDLVIRMKYRESMAAVRLLGSLMAAKLGREQYDMIVPVPLYAARTRWRGYNQSVELGRCMSNRSGIRLESRLVIRRRATSPQIELGAAARKTNLKGAFEVRGEVSGARVLLVDDVATTCTTVREVSRVLTSAGAAQIDVSVVARAQSR